MKCLLCRGGRFAVTASEDSTARVWDLQTQPLPAVQRHSTRVHGIASSTGGTTVTTLGRALLKQLCLHGAQGHPN